MVDDDDEEMCIRGRFVSGTLLHRCRRQSVFSVVRAMSILYFYNAVISSQLYSLTIALFC